MPVRVTITDLPECDDDAHETTVSVTRCDMATALSDAISAIKPHAICRLDGVISQIILDLKDDVSAKDLAINETLCDLSIRLVDTAEKIVEAYELFDEEHN